MSVGWFVCLHPSPIHKSSIKDFILVSRNRGYHPRAKCLYCQSQLSLSHGVMGRINNTKLYKGYSGSWRGFEFNTRPLHVDQNIFLLEVLILCGSILAGSIAACAKIVGVTKAAGGAKIGIAAAAMTAVATAAMSSKQEDSSKQPSK